MTKRVLMIAYHYPPVRGSSGVHRTLKFSQYLFNHDWQSIVLTVRPMAYPSTSDNQLKDIPKDTIVKRTLAFDTARHFAIAGIYPRPLALPDRWLSWWFSAVPSGLAAIRRYKPDIIWSTYPIATAHLIGLTLHRITGIPWVADFRDPMTDEDYPAEPSKRRAYRWIEGQTVKHCSRAVFTTPSAQRMYSERYPDLQASRCSVIANGYDEEDFHIVEKRQPEHHSDSQPLVLIHSGRLYTTERDPRPFFKAIAELKAAGRLSAGNLKVILRDTGHDDDYAPMLEEMNIADIIHLAPGIPYQDALSEMLSADGLLLFQAASCNHQVPAKLYEYLRARRPILALTDINGDTAAVLKEAQIDTIVPLDSQDKIRQGLEDFLSDLKKGDAPLASDAIIESHSRRSRTAKLAAVFDELAS
jgi:glycosyltransferase involved in cell wall biosynthesis